MKIFFAQISKVLVHKGLLGFYGFIGSNGTAKKASLWKPALPPKTALSHIGMIKELHMKQHNPCISCEDGGCQPV